MRTSGAIIVCLAVLSVSLELPTLAAGSRKSDHVRALQQTGSYGSVFAEGYDCSSDGACSTGVSGGRSCQDKYDTTHGTSCTPVEGTTSRCECTAGPLPVNAYCWANHYTFGAPCDPEAGLKCNAFRTMYSGVCLPDNIKNWGQDCGATGLSCRRGTSCVYMDANYLTNYTACQQPAPEGSCSCQYGPVPVGGYCFIYGAACEEGSVCYTGRADATGGYCRSTADPIVQTPVVAPASAPATAPAGAPQGAPVGAPEVAPAPVPHLPPVSQTGQACSPTGASCGNGDTCLDVTTGAVCGSASTDGCECSMDELAEGSRCDLYGAPCTAGLNCTTPRPDTTVGKCTLVAGPEDDAGGDLLPSGSDCTAMGTHCEEGSICKWNNSPGPCHQRSAPDQQYGVCTCDSGIVPGGADCDPWGAQCDEYSRCQKNSGSETGYTCLTTGVAPPSQPSCGSNGPVCGVGSSCVVSSGPGAGTLCSSSSQTCSCSATAMPANQICELFGAPCADDTASSTSTACRPSRADNVKGFCLPSYWPPSVNKAGAGSSSGGVTGLWTGGYQGPTSTGTNVPVSSASDISSPPPPPPPTPTATLRPVSKTATKVYSVKATCTLADVLLTDFQQAAYRTKFLATITSNIEALTGSPVNCTITSYKGGSVIATIQTDFLDNNQASATSYANTMKSGDPKLVFGTSYGGVTVDPSSVVTSQVTNPSRTSDATTTTVSYVVASILSLAVASVFLM